MQAVDETRSPNATGKLPDNSKHDLHNANMNTEDAIKSEALAGGSNLIVDPDGVSRVAVSFPPIMSYFCLTMLLQYQGHTVYLPVPCSGCVQAEKRCTGVQGKACDRCRSQRTKCSIPRGNGRGGAKSVDKSNTETKKSGGVKRKSEGGGQTRKRPRRDVTYFDSEAVDIEEAMEREESDDAFHIIGEYVAAYDKMVDWFRREKTRRARRS